MIVQTLNFFSVKKKMCSENLSSKEFVFGDNLDFELFME